MLAESETAGKGTKSFAVCLFDMDKDAERLPSLIWPLPVLQKTTNHLLRLLGMCYDEELLGLYTILWDPMRAIRMDLKMQHISTVEANLVDEHMIWFHVLAMHELCEYTNEGGPSEWFDGHLNIEQMN
ncbi:hypothetical protein O6H91_05G112900 [Diphasiastrum complanatum]|uniref:Uncharacterized protein n=1 Tax=Diphasiastrum complanatum TaxID=34168 RepID=A0ACC2DT30_DIPCM|nr:hypothetical protein O6H91_05G112900 [Diphasiastrum complanatum]